MNIEPLIEKSRKIRIKCLQMAMKYKDGHIASAFSCVDILVYLFSITSMRDDKIILSKGHACIALYACLKDQDFNPKISGHPDIDPINGIPCSTGSLGHGFPIGVGMAFAKKIQKRQGQVYVILGDGECQEGTIWESMNLAKKLQLNNLVVIIDYNRLQALRSTTEIMGEDCLVEKFRAFGGEVFEIDGHNFSELATTLTTKKNGLKIIIAHTVKGKGISFIEDKAEWHSRTPREAWINQALLELL